MKYLNKPLKILILTALLCLCMGVCAFAAGLEIEVSFQPDAAPSAEPAAIMEPEEDPASAMFTDLAYAENADELSTMIDKAYVAGYTDGSFRPGRSYTRLELAQLVTALCGLEEDANNLPAFYDTEIFGAEAIDAAVSQGLMSGRSETAFDPYGTVLKAELVGTLEKAAEKLGLDGFAIDEDWTADYSICTAAEAMHGAFLLDSALTEARDIALKEAAALIAAAEADEEIEFDQGESENDPAVAEDELVEATADEATEVEEETADKYADASGEPYGEASDEPSGEASAEPSEEPSDEASEEPASKPQEEPAAPPAGVSTPAGQQSAAPAPAAPAPAASEAEPSEPDNEADAIRQQIFDIYETVKDSVVSFLKTIFG